MPILAASAAAAAGAGSSLFGYNRENYLYDRKMRQETEYQIMDFRIKQAELWREDVRDIIGLTSVKMDTYLIVNAVQLGFTVMAFCEGRLASGTPSWLVGCHTLSLAGAFMYLLMSVWFSMHASVTAKSYEVRLLTQLVRLPVPSWSQLESARTYGSTFEKSATKQMFRVPFAMGTQERVLGTPAAPSADPSADPALTAAGSEGEAQAQQPAAPGPTASADLWGLEGTGDSIYELDGTLRSKPDKLDHLQLIKEVMQYWQSYDGFARVAMSMGTNQLIMGLSYYVIGYVLISNKAVVACFLVVLLFMVIATALIRLDMSLTGLEFRAAVALVFAGPCLTALAAQQWRLHTVKGYEMVHLLAPLPYAFSAAWLMLLLYISKVGEQEGGAMLPTGFRSVMYIDVFGWIKRAKESAGVESAGGLAEVQQLPAPSPVDATPSAGKGPAMESVSWAGSVFKTPSPTRPETMPGAARPPQQPNKEFFNPTSFVPREKEGHKVKDHDNEIHPYLRPGFVPWRIFCSATSLLLVLWWISGVLVLLQASGWSALRVSPLLHDEQEGPAPIDEGHGAAFLLDQATKSNVSFIQVRSSAPISLIGEHIETHWPHLAGSAPRRLACSMDAEGKIALAATSRFGLFTSQVEAGVKGKSGHHSSSNRSAVFQYAPPCDDLDGEALQDVSMVCGGADGHCQALVLHRQGQRLTSCKLSASEDLSKPAKSLPALMSLSDGWLGDGDAAAGHPQEEVSSIALAGHCFEAEGQCAYAETTSGRLVELKTGLSTGNSDEKVPDWFPTRVLLADVGNSKTREGGSLHMLGHQYIGVLAKQGTELRALDPRSGGGIVGRWPLPESKRWSSMCSVAGSLYLLGEGSAQQPQIFRFPLPFSLQPAAQIKPVLLSEKTATHGSHARATHRKHSSSSKGILATQDA